MVNGVGVLAWGVGGIEAEAAMLGQPVTMLIPEVIGFRLDGKLREGVTATDLVLKITEMLRKKGVVGKFVEFFGKGLSSLPVADRTTIGNMSPEFGSTCAIFPIDDRTLEYLRLTGALAEHIALVEAYAKAQGLFRTDATPDAEYTDVVSTRSRRRRAEYRRPAPSAGSRESARREDVVQRPRCRSGRKRATARTVRSRVCRTKAAAAPRRSRKPAKDVADGSVVIAAITSCTNTSNPSVLIGAGLLARNAVERGLQTQAVGQDLARARIESRHRLSREGRACSAYLDELGFNLVGYGCTTCIGNSGPLPADVAETVAEQDLIVAAVLSGNRNFEGRIHPQVRANYLASPPLVVAYALAGRMDIDLTTEPHRDRSRRQAGLPQRHLAEQRGDRKDRRGVRDRQRCSKRATPTFSQATTIGPSCRLRRANATTGIPRASTSSSRRTSTTCRREPAPLADIKNARVLAVFGDSITTDHISPAGNIAQDLARGEVSDGARHRAEGLQLVRRAPRQSRSDGARHVRQRALAQSARSGRRRRRHAPSARRTNRCRSSMRR